MAFFLRRGRQMPAKMRAKKQKTRSRPRALTNFLSAFEKIKAKLLLKIRLFVIISFI